MNDAELRRLIREAVEPVGDVAPPRDLWPSVEAHRERRTVPPWFDLSLAAAILTALLTRPDWLVLVAYFF